MPELELHDALVDLADQSEAVDLIDRVRVAVQARRQRRTAIAAVATAAAVAAVIAVSLALSTGPQATPTSPGPTPIPSPIKGPLATRSVTPRYLPPGVRLAGHRRITLPSGPRGPKQVGPEPILSWYRLPGAVNRSTEGQGGDTLRQHPSTELDVQFDPGVRHLPPNVSAGDATSRRLFRKYSIRIAGNRAVVTADRSDSTDVRIDWIDADGYHVVQCEGLTTSKGPSGLPVTTVIRIARSLYPPATSEPAPSPLPTVGQGAALRYASVGVTLVPASPSVKPSITRDQAIHTYRASGFNQHRRFVVELVRYHHGWPPPTTQPGLLAWAITVPKATVISYGPTSAPDGTTEPFVMVINASTGKILANFQERPAAAPAH